MSNSEQHELSGVGEETTVSCVDNNEYGPGGDSDELNYCPYCGADADDSEHAVDEELQEVFCESTTMSTWRYCPRCGERLSV